jgi:hypothetical protein
MARQLLGISGKIGNMIYFQRNGETFMRSVGKVKQTKATEKWKKKFGMASRVGKQLRILLKPVIPFPLDKSMQSRFSGSISKWLKKEDPGNIQPSDNLSFVKGFSFNQKTSVDERWKAGPEVKRTGKNIFDIIIPAFVPIEKISAPVNTSMVKCTITTAACRFANVSPGGSMTTVIEFPYDSSRITAQTVQHKLPLEKGSIVVTAILLTYLIDKQGGISDNTREAFIPATVIGAMYCN